MFTLTDAATFAASHSIAGVSICTGALQVELDKITVCQSNVRFFAVGHDWFSITRAGSYLDGRQGKVLR
jgi:hypothetical protein